MTNVSMCLNISIGDKIDPGRRREFKQRQQGSVAEWSKALVLGTSLFGGVGSNPTAAKNVTF